MPAPVDAKKLREQTILFRVAAAFLLAAAVLVVALPLPVALPVRLAVGATDLIAAAVLWLAWRQRARR